MFDNELQHLEIISQTVGNSPDLVQGGGGNTSVKLSDELMAVKASGFKLSQITAREGYVVVNYKNIREYYEHVDLSSDTDFEKDSVEFVKKNIVAMEGIKTLRPSVEAGFHSILKKYVIHTHPVYANILCCGDRGKEVADKIFGTANYAYIWVPYINPGFCLTLKIREEIERYIEKIGKFPEIVFMEKHGLIVCSDDHKRAIDLHAEVNNRIKEFLSITEPYPEIQLESIDDNTFRSKTTYIVDFFKNTKVSADFFDKVILYPDQLVYLNGSVSIDGNTNKLCINTSTGEIVYRTNLGEARTIEETLLAYLFVVNKVAEAGMNVNSMTPKEVDFIKNWESEAYRKSLVKLLGR